MKKRMMKVLLALTLVVSLCVGCGAPATGNDVGTENEAGTETNLGTENESVDTTEMNSDVTQQENDETNENVKNEYEDFAIADVDGYVNVRKEPNTEAEIVGKIFDGAVAQILSVAGENDEWFQIVSGNVEGYIKAEFFIYGDAAVEVIDQYVTKYAKVNVQQLNVRADKSTDSEKIGYLEADDKVKLLEDCGEWLKIQYREGKTGYVAAEYVSIVDEFVYGKTLEEEQKELEEERERQEREEEEKEDEDDNDNGGDDTIEVQPPEVDYRTNEELRRAIVNYAMQYLGHKYVHGGQSLAGGTDCSGFTMYVLLEFGISIGRTPQSQYTSAGRAISYSEIQPGDIICYSGNGGKSCTHVAFYIGDGKILHAANSRDGVKISSATYTNIYGVRNVID